MMEPNELNDFLSNTSGHYDDDDETRSDCWG